MYNLNLHAEANKSNWTEINFLDFLAILVYHKRKMSPSSRNYHFNLTPKSIMCQEPPTVRGHNALTQFCEATLECPVSPSSSSSAVTVMITAPTSVFSGTEALYCRCLKKGGLSFLSVMRIWISASPVSSQHRNNSSGHFLTLLLLARIETVL